MQRRILITGCSGGGKSTLLAALAAAGHATVPEPGRRIVAEELAGDGSALPWVNPAAFARRALALARADLAAATGALVFFDRGLIDAAVALLHIEGIPLTVSLGGPSPYTDPVFLTPPWPELFATDPERQHGLDDALAEYARIAHALPALGHRVMMLPKCPIAERVAFVLNTLS
ncbi:MAG TPA: AAA family ATPase [Tabrizicola sp.]|nr:AAA family ATPase [Tabrizicola sp.]